MNWTDHLNDNESLVWQGKPAPRCYTMRNWPHSLFGLVLLLSCLVWFYVGINIEHDDRYALYSWLPVPFLLASLYLIFGHLVLARLEWNSVFYAVSDQRVLVQRGLFKKYALSLPLEDIVWFRMKPYSENLGTVSIRGSGLNQKLSIVCIEYPRQLTNLLENAMVKSGKVPDRNPGDAQSGGDQ